MIKPFDKGTKSAQADKLRCVHANQFLSLVPLPMYCNMSGDNKTTATSHPELDFPSVQSHTLTRHISSNVGAIEDVASAPATRLSMRPQKRDKRITIEEFPMQRSSQLYPAPLHYISIPSHHKQPHHPNANHTNANVPSPRIVRNPFRALLFYASPQNAAQPRGPNLLLTYLMQIESFCCTFSRLLSFSGNRTICT